MAYDLIWPSKQFYQRQILIIGCLVCVCVRACLMITVLLLKRSNESQKFHIIYSTDFSTALWRDKGSPPIYLLRPFGKVFCTSMLQVVTRVCVHHYL